MQKPFDEGFAVDDYYFSTQAFGYTPYCSTDNYNARKPNRAQLRATTMLALAHGAKGILYWNYYSYLTRTSNCGTVQLIDAIVDTNFQPTDLYDEIKDNIFPRLNGTLGNALVNLNYTGNYISFSGGSSNGMIHTQDYLSIWQGAQQVSYHAGLLEDKLTDFNKYFLVMNKLTDADRYCQMYINYDHVITDYTNWRVRNVEGGFDTSFSSNNYLHFYDSLKAGDGKLFQVAPVVNYGGSLIANETISTPTTLTSELTIENGAILTINSRYDVYKDIIVKQGGKIQGTTNTNSKLVFHGEAKLILEGNAEICGTSSNKLLIDFGSPASGRTIYVKHNATAKIQNCKIKNAYAGISIDDDIDDLEIVNNTFENCTFGIKLEQNTLASPYIFNNTFIGCGRGIFALALNTINIGKNIISADVPIWLESTAYPIITLNTLSPSVPGTGAGIYLSSCSGGLVRKNNINDFSNGVFLNQSSPKLFDNKITGNSGEGIYIGAGSNPVLKPGFASQGESTYLIDDAGFNFVYENGNSINTEGTEITIYNANPLLDYGSNNIFDDRETTSLLINGTPDGNTRDFYVRHNYWGMYGEDPRQRFGFDVLYEPYLSDESGYVKFNPYTYIVDNVGRTIDTIFVILEVFDQEQKEKDIAAAEEKFYAGAYDESLSLYKNISSTYSTDELPYEVYARQFTIEKLNHNELADFAATKTEYTAKAAQTTDATLAYSINHLCSMIDVHAGEYSNAINSFTAISDSVPGTEEAIFAEMDAATAEYLAGATGVSLGKSSGRLKKNNIQSLNEYYLEKLSTKFKFIDKLFNKEEELPTEFSLMQNYPNPFNPVTKISFAIPKKAKVNLSVYDILGRQITTLADDYKEPGSYEYRFDASSYASGVYVYRLTTDNFVVSKKMLYLK